MVRSYFSWKHALSAVRIEFAKCCLFFFVMVVHEVTKMIVMLL